MKKILLEASGSMVGAYMISAIEQAGHLSVASDISNKSVGNYLADEFIIAQNQQTLIYGPNKKS